ncbi:unnamed protein product, partial [Ostreobium quekettii]
GGAVIQSPGRCGILKVPPGATSREMEPHDAHAGQFARPLVEEGDADQAEANGGAEEKADGSACGQFTKEAPGPHPPCDLPWRTAAPDVPHGPQCSDDQDLVIGDENGQASCGPNAIEELPKLNGKPVNKCVQCGATDTPQWRNGPSGPRSLCNACGIRMHRRSMREGGGKPLRKGAIKKRKNADPRPFFLFPQGHLGAPKVQTTVPAVAHTQLALSRPPLSPPNFSVQGPGCDPYIPVKDVHVANGSVQVAPKSDVAKRECGDVMPMVGTEALGGETQARPFVAAPPTPLPSREAERRPKRQAALASRETTKRVASAMRRHPRQQQPPKSPEPNERDAHDDDSARASPSPAAIRPDASPAPHRRTATPTPSACTQVNEKVNAKVNEKVDEKVKDPLAGFRRMAEVTEVDAAIQLMALCRAPPDGPQGPPGGPMGPTPDCGAGSHGSAGSGDGPFFDFQKGIDGEVGGGLGEVECMYTEVVRAEWEWQAAEKAVQAVAKSLASLTAEAAQARKRYRDLSGMLQRRSRNKQLRAPQWAGAPGPKSGLGPATETGEGNKSKPHEFARRCGANRGS